MQLECKQDLNTHPIFNQSEFFIKTPMIENLSKQIHYWLWNGLTGAVIIGNYRLGKTRAAQFIADKLINRSNQKIPVHKLAIPKRDVKTVASVYRNLCYSLDINITQRTTADEMANDLFHYFGEMALVNNTHQAVLLVDEMQRLSVHQIEAFAELYDRLSEVGINLSVFFIGNSASSQNLIAQVMRPENELVRGRFFTQKYIFHGIKTHSELRACLMQYDKIKYPDTNSPTITEMFMADEYRNGWRLESISHNIWDVYSENYRSKLKLESWGMQYFLAMLKTLLIDYLPNFDIDDPVALDAMINESIKISGLVPNLVEVA